MHNSISISKKIIQIAALVSLTVALAVSAAFFFQRENQASAVKASDFNPGRIIDDAVFYNSGAMTPNQIQTFLDAKNPNCDTNGTGRAVEWGRSDITRATLASYIRNGTNGYAKNTSFHAPPYTCLRNFKQNTPQVEAASGLCESIPARSNRTAAQIIKDVADACGINPQVLLVLLEKEQSLVTDIWPLNLQYQRATGFACPDNAGGACDPSFNGFFRQVYAAARQFKVYRAFPNNYNYSAGRTNNIFWQTNGGNFISDGRAASRRNGQCGYSEVYIQNQATAALYVYTPYRPNQAALNNYPGTGDACSAYGNRNFWFMFSGWFGDPIQNPGQAAISKRYSNLTAAEKDSLGNPIGNLRCSLKSDGCYQRYENGAILWSPSTGAWESKGSIRNRWAQLGYENGVLGYPTSGEIRLGNTGGWYQRYENGYIIGKSSTGYWESKGSIRNRWAQLGYESGSLGYPIGPEIAIPTGGWQQEYERGAIIGRGSTGYWETSGPILKRHQDLGGGAGKIGYPTAGVRCGLIKDGCYQSYQRGIILWTEETGAWESLGSIRAFWITTGWEGGALGYPTGPELQDATGAWSQKYEKGVIHSKKGVSSAVFN
jgi:hypothetical protein